jgi:hypothetical protein
MGININYVVYELNNVMGSEKHKALQKVDFKGFKQNSFSTEEEAIQAIVDDGKYYEDLLIIKQVYIN